MLRCVSRLWITLVLRSFEKMNCVGHQADFLQMFGERELVSYKYWRRAFSKFIKEVKKKGKLFLTDSSTVYFKLNFYLRNFRRQNWKKSQYFFIIVTVTIISATASLMATNFIAFLVLRTINGGLMSSLFQLPFIIVLEFVGPAKRALTNAVPNVSWAVGLCILPLIAHLSKNWIVLGSASISLALLMYGYWKCLGKECKEKNKIKKERKCSKYSILDILKYPYLRKKFLIVTYSWIANDLAYFGLQYNLPNLEGNPFLTFFVLSIVELPGLLCIWYLMEKWGRRWSSASFLGWQESLV
ncbi:organic cation transporter 1 [Caerostris extrusa]|uniref:Organic cation transporter 1 n=1 Tax=Caerostris extrusa TaxID=172846 RepID=A0AAV4Y1V3_CAEEX|nr:organic cation transporter 1 [Caerostris extrusa]